MDISISSDRPTDAALGARFLEAGYVVQPSEDHAALDRIRVASAQAAAKILSVSLPADIGGFLNTIHERVKIADLNAFRLSVLEALLANPNFRPAYFACGRKTVEAIVGNELAMQRNIGFSMQLPNDDSSLLPLHSDTWGSECSPFEVVLWIPLVDCSRTKSMFILPPEKDRVWRGRVGEFEAKGTEELFKAVEPELTWIDIKYGEVMLFTPTVMHGNRVNREAGTRWSFNMRFKGLFTPYANKKLGDYFSPVAIKPASQLGLSFDMPGIADG
jgi:sporadic carbohydrate cluster 2OG-Fe(II) oxygenase